MFIITSCFLRTLKRKLLFSENCDFVSFLRKKLFDKINVYINKSQVFNTKWCSQSKFNTIPSDGYVQLLYETKVSASTAKIVAKVLRKSLLK